MSKELNREISVGEVLPIVAFEMEKEFEKVIA